MVEDIWTMEELTSSTDWESVSILSATSLLLADISNMEEELSAAEQDRLSTHVATSFKDALISEMAVDVLVMPLACMLVAPATRVAASISVREIEESSAVDFSIFPTIRLRLLTISLTTASRLSG